MSLYLRYLLLSAVVGAVVGYAVLLFDGARQQPPVPSNGYADAVAAAGGSVVNIHTTQVVQQRRPPVCELPRYRDMCEAFFGPARRMQSSLGSGVIVRGDGYILTNAHVIANAHEILVDLHNGETATGSVVGVDPETDLAVIQVEAEALQPVAIGSSDEARIGDIVLAIGNPFGIGQTVSEGIISAKGRGGANPYESFIQTDAAINPGSSGGALIDTRGRLIGINAQMVSQNGGSQGIGFAIPSDLALEVLEQLIREGEVIRGFLGIEVDNLAAASTDSLPVAEVVPESPAARAGLRAGDEIIAIDGEPVDDPRAAARRIGLVEPGSELRLELRRNGERLEVEAIAARRPVPRIEP